MKNVMISLLLILALCLSSWSIIHSKKPQKLIAADTSNQPDSMMEEVIATIINKEGSPALKIETPKMVHYSKNDTTDIDAPQITVYRDSPKPWHIHSNYAKATKGVEQILFWNHVVIKHDEDTANPMTTVKTETLTVFPNKQMAQTQDPIILIQPATIIHAVGMLANLSDGTVKLLSNARGEYVPS